MGRSEELRLDPWGATVIHDYEKAMKTFGIKPFYELLDKIENPHSLMKRGVIFGHRDYDTRVLEALKKKEKVALVTGFMPSGKVHFGHKILMDQIIYYQRLGLELFIPIADAEAYAVRKLSRKEVVEYAVTEYVANLIALGLENKKVHIYFQTNYETPYYRLIQMFSRKVTLAELEAIYGRLEPGKIMAALTQAADILHPQLEAFGEYKNIIVPVGIDQDPHIRLVRDLADRFGSELGLERPASTYHRFMTGLDGNKMSSSRPEYAIFLSDPPEIASKKLANAITGGRATAKEQRELGGIPEKCSVYEFYLYHLIKEDASLKAIYDKCRNGEILCGECKAYARELLVKWLRDHQRKLEQAIDKAYKYVDVPEF